MKRHAVTGLIVVVAAMVMGVSAGYGLAQAGKEQASAEDIKKMLKVSGQLEASAVAIDMMGDAMRPMVNAPDDQWKAFLAEMRAEVDGLMNDLVPVIQKHLDAKTVKAMIAFYESPEGKAYAAAVPGITKDSMQAGQRWGMALGQKFQQRLRERGFVK